MHHANTQERTARGFSLIELLIVVAIIGILIAIVVPAYNKAIQKTNETSAIKTLKAIQEEQAQYSLSTKGNYGTFDELLKAGHLDKRFAGEAPVVDGYIYTMKVTPKGSGNQVATYGVNADPQQSTGVSATGTRHFYIGSDVSGIHANNEQPANAGDDPL